MKYNTIAFSLIIIIALSMFFVFGSHNQDSSSLITEPPSSFLEKTKDPKYTILDIRTSQEYESGAIVNAINIDYYQTEIFNQELDKLDKNKPYLIYCRTGNRSSKALTIMKQKGFKNVIELQGGILAWQSQNLPTVCKNC